MVLTTKGHTRLAWARANHMHTDIVRSRKSPQRRKDPAGNSGYVGKSMCQADLVSVKTVFINTAEKQ